MSTLTISSPAHAGSSYAQNVGRAARALLDAILSFRQQPAAAAKADGVRAKTRDTVSLYRLYALSSPYDSLMPNLRQELQAMACRDDRDA